MKQTVEEFNTYREEMNEKLLGASSKILKRIYSVDSQAYKAGALDVPTKELLGLVASAVLRCDDCVKYHLQKCFQEKVTTAAVMEALEIATVVGGTIVIPHLRKAYEFWEALEHQSEKEA